VNENLNADRSPSIAVVVPTFRRADLLGKCLRGLFSQTSPPEELVVACRSTDAESELVVRSFGSSIKIARTDRPGTVAALQAGAALARSDVIAFLDDDAIPRPDWIERLRHAYSDPDVGGVGGRDVIVPAQGTGNELRGVVGSISRWGRHVGNHHVGAGGPRNVDVLKGCNMSFRRKYIFFPSGLRGSGAEPAHDLATSLRAKAAGARLVYDSSIQVDHFPAIRYDEQVRAGKSREGYAIGVYNETLAICSVRPELRLRYFLYHFFVGTTAIPGVARSAVARARREDQVSRRFLSTQATVLVAVLRSRYRPLSFTTVQTADR